MDFGEAPGGLAGGPKLASVDGLRQLQGGAVVAGAPAQSEQVARTERFGHVQHEEKTVSSLGIGQDQPELLPTQNLLVLRSKIFRDLQFTGRVFDQELVLDSFVEDGLQIRSRLLDPVLRVSI